MTGVILNEHFGQPGTGYATYVSYMDRPEAIENEHMSLTKFVMEEDEHSKGLFTETKNTLTQEEKEKLKEVFTIAENNKGLMWYPIISFDNEWLRENGVLSKEGDINEIQLRSACRRSMAAIIKAEGLENAIWTAAIHYNTDNIHIHTAIVEPIPMREKITHGKYAGQYRGMWKQSSINKGKSAIVNSILEKSIENQQINQLIRDQLVAGAKGKDLIRDQQFAESMATVYEGLQCIKDRRRWNYGSREMNLFREQIDRLSEEYLKHYHPEDYEKLDELLKVQDKRYQDAYGVSKQSKYSDGKRKDLYQRLGNALLKQLRDFDKEEKTNQYLKEKRRRKQQWKKKRHTAKSKYELHEMAYRIRRSMSDMTKALDDEWRHIKNQMEHEEWERQMQQAEYSDEYDFE